MSGSYRIVRPPVLAVRVEILDRWPTITSVCPGYERREWRQVALARDLFDRHLLSFASKYGTFSTVTGDTAASDLRNAAKIVYDTEKYRNRGEYGELILHALLRDLYGGEAAVSKIFFKDGPNETVKGFDAVHVTYVNEKLELWLGEVKFYTTLTDAIYDVSKELGLHLDDDYLRGEFLVINNKIDPNWPHAGRLSALIDENTSLDQIFDRLTIPVLLTYESAAVARNAEVSDAYIGSLKAEAERAWENFAGKIGPNWDIEICLILLPMKSKHGLVDSLHERLLAWQQI